jgi:transforming growth factor-beta-induced protein
MAIRSIAIAAAVGLAASQPTKPNLPELIAGNRDLQLLAHVLENNGLIPTLSGTGPFTVFGPTDQAFQALGKNIVDFVANGFNAKVNDNVLTYHVAAGATYASQLYNGEKIPSLDAPYTLGVTIAGGRVSINTAHVIQADLNASNGVLHIIDAVLVPENFALPKQDIIALAQATPSLSTLVSAIVTAKLVPALQCTAQQCNPFTVFAPNNAAFAKLPSTLLSYLLAHPPQLAQVLFYHLLDHRIYSTEIHNFEYQQTLDNEEIIFVVSGGKVLINGNSTVLTADVQAENGVVHIIDTVLIPNHIQAAHDAWLAAGAPKAQPNLVQLVQSVPSLSTLATALGAANLVNVLEGPGPFTVLAPNNNAFANLPADFLAYLLANPATALTQVLTYHVLPINLPANKIVDGERYATVEGNNVTAHLNQGKVYFDHAQVISANNFASNGVAHIIDAVLLPVNWTQWMH